MKNVPDKILQPEILDASLDGLCNHKMKALEDDDVVLG